MRRSVKNIRAYGFNARQLGTDPTANIATALADGHFAGGLKPMRADRLYSLHRDGVKLLPHEQEIVRRYMDENHIPGPRP